MRTNQSSANVEKIIYGAGGHARVVLDIAKDCGIEFTRVLDDKPSSARIAGLPVSEASEDEIRALLPFTFIVAIGKNDVRRRIYLKLSEYGRGLNVVHPFTSVSGTAKLGSGVAIMPGVVVNTGSEIHDNVILNTSCSIDHDCVIGAHSHICPGVHIAGGVTVGAGTMIGTGAAVIPGITIGANCTIGAGAVVVRDIPDGSTAYGSPCRVQGRAAICGEGQG